jgi:hypothetical protein
MNLAMETLDHGTCTAGILMANGVSFYTIEQPWRDNEISESYVPAGARLHDLDDRAKALRRDL